jgi:Zn finger protein HypA/HybF involved in hydrogenase expression
MRKNDVTCPDCGAGFKRLELSSKPGTQGAYHCPVCDTALEIFDGKNLVAYRLTVHPTNKTLRA